MQGSGPPLRGGGALLRLDINNSRDFDNFTSINNKYGKKYPAPPPPSCDIVFVPLLLCCYMWISFWRVGLSGSLSWFLGRGAAPSPSEPLVGLVVVSDPLAYIEISVNKGRKIKQNTDTNVSHVQRASSG